MQGPTFPALASLRRGSPTPVGADLQVSPSRSRERRGIDERRGWNGVAPARNRRAGVRGQMVRNLDGQEQGGDGDEDHHEAGGNPEQTDISIHALRVS